MIRQTFERTRKWLLSRWTLSRHYRPSADAGHVRMTLDRLPPFTLYTADLMLRDPHVLFGLMVRNGALLNAEVEVSGNPRQVEFVREQFQRIWQHFGGMLLRAKRYGYLPLEATYREIHAGPFAGMLGVKHLHDFHPRDGQLMLRGGEVAGVRFRSAGGNETLLPTPASVWLTYDQQYGNPYGRSINENSYPLWYEKWMQHGAKDVLRLRMMKDGYSGDIFWVPDELVPLPDGTKVHYMDIVKKAQQSRLAGSSMTLIKKFDTQGRELTGYTPPHDNGRPEGILEWNDRIDWDIWKGQGVYREVFEAATSGSGFSGRSIPLLMFLGSVSEELKELLACLDRDLLRPLTHINFGVEPDYHIRALPLSEIFARHAAGSPLGGSAISK